MTSRRDSAVLPRTSLLVALGVTAALTSGACSASRTQVAPPTMAPGAPGATAPAPAPAPAPTPAPPAASGAAAPAAPRPPAAPPLVGAITRDDLKRYTPWESVLAQPYTPDAGTTQALGARFQGVTVLAIVGTWCPDTKREVPRFLTILTAAGLPDTLLTMVGVDRTKKDAGGLTETWAVTRVPTFVFLRDGKEIGRIVERVAPESTLEREMLRIAGGQLP